MTRSRLVLATVLTVALGLVGPAAVDTAAAGGRDGDDGHPWHDGHGSHAPDLTVMTQNLYLGSPLTPALAATTPDGFVAAVATIYATAVATDFPTRAQAIADTVAREQPDLVGLQEVSRWVTQPLTETADPPGYDFLAILQAALAERGLDYRVAAVSENADIGPAPLVSPAFGCGVPADPTRPQCLVTLQDRDVILVNQQTPGLQVRRSASGDYTAQQEFTPPGTGTPVSFARGWAAIDATYRGARFRLVDTHLEVEDFASVQEAQAEELLAGPARTGVTVIAVGDLNSAADPTTADRPTTTYADLTRSWFRDAWWVNDDATGATCCQNGELSNADSRLRTRIDLVLLHGDARASEARVVGDQPIGGLPPSWASDHAGVVARVLLARHH